MRGQGAKRIDELDSLAEAIQDGSLCALGGSAPNPVLTTLRYFRDEYLAHILEKKCPAGVCKALITYPSTKTCTGCMACARNCPQKCITGEKKKPHHIDPKAASAAGFVWIPANSMPSMLITKEDYKEALNL